MARVMKHQKLVNPAKRKLSLKQKLHFGTARQRASAKLALRSRGKPKRKLSIHHRRRVVNPIGTIITLGANPGKVGTMRKRRRNTSSKRRVARRNPVARRRARRNPFAVTHRRRSRRSPSRVVYASRRRRFNPRRRRNPDIRGVGTKVLGIIGGAALTKLVTAMLPASFQTGILKYLGTGVVALGLGWGVKKFGSPTLAENVTAGGLTLLGLQVLSDVVPGLAAYSGLSVSGMGNILASSSFYTPQVNSGNSMTRFVTPAGVTQAIPVAVSTHKGLKGMGRLAVSRGGGW